MLQSVLRKSKISDWLKYLLSVLLNCSVLSGMAAVPADAWAQLDNRDMFELNDSTVFTPELAETIATYDSISYSRDLKEDSNYGTLCLPFACTSESFGVKFYTIKTFRDTVLILNEVTEAKAGEPVIFYAKNVPGKLQYKDCVKELVLSPTNSKIYGTFVKDSIKVDADKRFFVKKNRLVRGNGSFVVLPFHAYFYDATVASKLKSFSLFADDEMEAVVEADNEGKNVSLSGIYNMKGQQVQEMQKNEVYILRMSDGTSRKVMVE